MDLDDDLTLGYQFSVNGSVTINALAVFDVTSAYPGSTSTFHANGRGLNADHAVAIWNSTGTVAQATVQRGGPTIPSANSSGVWVHSFPARP